ncbi:MAG: hypothetical protein ACP5N1_02245 [Candidatus Woesearchaeota archaeon]
MIAEEEHYEKRHELREFLTKIHPNQIETELAIFDAIYHTKKERVRKENEAIAELYQKYSGPLAKKNEEQNFITDLKHFKKTYKHDTAFSILLITGNIEEYDYNKHYGKFKTNNYCIDKYIGDKQIIQNLETLSEQDGAIVLNNKGIILLTNAYLTNIDLNNIPETQLNMYDITKERNDPKFYGFKQDVSTRHLSAIRASYTIPAAVLYTLGENMDKRTPDQPKLEHGQIRRYEQGLITLSTLFLEEKTTHKNQKYLIEKNRLEKIF